MYDRPFLHEFQSGTGERPFETLKVAISIVGEFAIGSMEVRRRVGH